MANDHGLTIGFPRMYNEPGERRAFLPPLIGELASMDGVDVYVEAGSGAGMGIPDDVYAAASPRVHVVDEATAYRQDIVVVLRAPGRQRHDPGGRWGGQARHRVGGQVRQ